MVSKLEALFEIRGFFEIGVCLSVCLSDIHPWIDPIDLLEPTKPIPDPKLVLIIDRKMSTNSTTRIVD